ncbi:MAG: hypothetical protein J6Z05_00830 [Lachnospiraceae bacterium]|nr:hypothetical protein [Lachnospiraceae bacterium]
MTQVIIITVAALLIFFGAGYRKEQLDKKAYEEKLKKDYGKISTRKLSSEELKSIKGYTNYHLHDDLIDDITWNDLDMNLVYSKMNYCKSSAGDEYLYYILRSPQTADYDWSDIENKIDHLKEDSVYRTKLSVCLHDIGRTKNYSIYSYIDKLDEAKRTSAFMTIAGVLMYIPAIAICFFNLVVGISLIFVLALFNIATYFKQKSIIEPYIICFEYVFRILKNCDQITQVIKNGSDILSQEMTDLVSISNDFRSFKRFSSLVIGDLGSGPLGIVLDYIKMLTHLDLIKFNTMLDQIKLHRDHVDKIITIIGKIDCYISIGEYRTSLLQFCIPKLDDTYDGIRIEDGYHPLLDNPVPNSINTNKCILLTGSNASGKSTFLKMVAVNALLSQTIHTSCSKEYEAPYFNIYSSLSLKDSIVTGESYYMVEIKTLKRIMDASIRKKHVLGFVDEVLRGTNTTERIAASSAILRNLSDKGVLVFAATHDLELTSILDDIYENYHFEEEMKDDDVTFPYKLSCGKTTSRNAIKLLDILGYDKNIVIKANEIVKEMEERR